MSRILFFLLLLFATGVVFGQTSSKNLALEVNQVAMEFIVENTDYVVGRIVKMDDKWEFTEEKGLEVAKTTQQKAIFRSVDFKLLLQQTTDYVTKNGEDCYGYIINRDDEIWNISIYSCD